MPRGGRRSGTPGNQYPNRTDLSAKPLPVTTAPGQPYGAAATQAAAQATVPMAPAPALPVPPPASTTAPSAAPQPVPAGPPPGGLGQFLGPSQRPDEHVMAGAPSGPGPGPEALGLQPPTATVGGLLQTLAANPLASGEIRDLLNKVQGGRA